jgi:hypothetical protein
MVVTGTKTRFVTARKGDACGNLPDRHWPSAAPFQARNPYLSAPRLNFSDYK